MRRFCATALGVMLALTLSTAAGASLPGSSTQACSTATSKLVYLYTLYIEARPAKKSYPRGDKVKVHIKVTRPSDQEPSGSGQPMPRVNPQPAEGATVGGALTLGNTYTWDHGAVTDEKGKATLNIPIPPNADTGWARGDFSAEIVHYNNNGCPDVREVGYRSYPRFVKITP